MKNGLIIDCFEANGGYLKVGERQPVLQIRNAVTEEDGQMRFV